MLYRYRITIEALGKRRGAPDRDESLQFCAENHDDLLKIVEAVRSKRLLDIEKSASLAIGLKLLSEVILEKRQDEIFAPLVLPIREFIVRLKETKTQSEQALKMSKC
jgi:Domain of Unknown Function with PDB structure (DUF3861)